MSRSVKLTVADVVTETPDACSLVFDAPEGFDYRPGQFLTVRIPSDRTGSVARCYSLASSPHTGEAPKVTVKRTAAGFGSNWLCDNVKRGDTLEVLLPSGLFTPKNLDDDLLLFAAGSGVTPIMSIVKSALVRGTGQVALIYANRDPESVIFAAELDELAAAHPRLTVVHWLETGRGGLPTAAQLAEEARPFVDYQAFLCGPGPFLDVVHGALDALGVPRTRVHTEVFTSLTGDPFAGPAEVEADAEGAATVDVELDGQVHTLRWPRANTLVDVMLGAGIDVPYSCQAGECGSCMCTLVEGEVTMDNPEILDPADIETGYILGCQAHPATDRLKIEF
ncbi:MAG: ferredoxin--NADP reductase [Mycobacteriaceae bacterium]|nr:ferredoxin--NADP reductase [Mycobacteriaceae bacterium]